MRVGICDDEAECVSELYSMVKMYYDNKNLEYSIKTYLTGGSVLRELDSLDILLLDMDMPDVDGTVVGRRIIESELPCKVILVTGRTDRYKEGFKIKAIRFVSKPIHPEELHEVLETALLSQIGQSLLACYSKNYEYKVLEGAVDYLEAYNGYTLIHAGKNIYRREESLAIIEKELDKTLFFRINRQIVVNMKNIVLGNKTRSVQIGSCSFLVARSRWKKFLDAYIEFDLKYSRYLR